MHQADWGLIALGPELSKPCGTGLEYSQSTTCNYLSFATFPQEPLVRCHHKPKASAIQSVGSHRELLRFATPDTSESGFDDDQGNAARSEQR